MRKFCCPGLFPYLILFIFKDIPCHVYTKDKPYFDPASDTEVTVPATGAAYLHCKVHNLGKVEIAWIRQSDRQVISVQEDMLINDDRFQMFHRKNSNDWCLIINYSNFNDSGAYECLLSTDPPLRLTVRLHIVENNVSISGTSYVEEGDTIVVRCAIRLKVKTGNLPSSILWYVNDTLISFKKNTKYNRYTTKGKTAIISELRVRAATLSDSGIYSCKCENAPARKFRVTVEEYEWTWANQRNISHENSGELRQMSCINQNLFLASALTYQKPLSIILVVYFLLFD